MYSMKETCQKVGMTYETLKFYCNEGLVPNVKRDSNNYRIFDDRDVNWLSSLSCLKKCGMSIQDMKTYIALCFRGQSTIPERKKMLDNLKDDLVSRIADLNSCVDFIDTKQQFYDDVLAGKVKYYSNLINIED